ncbi:MAG: divergent PAP2 family protein [Clostridia bacterium]|nr:divergent PAP2 family protein [Clostridia bacterium]
MEILKAIITNHVLIAPISAWVITQIVKALINLLVYKEFKLERLLGDGGMPSTHSATVMCLCIMTGWVSGFSTPIFALSFVFAAVVMRDALGVRREAGKHASSIKQLAEAVNGLFHSKDSEIKTENLKVLVGHTPLQVIFGAITGAIIAILYILIFSL